MTADTRTMTDTKCDIFTEIDDELNAYDQLYDAGMTHEEGFDFARRWNGTLCAALKEIITLRVERTAALAENVALWRVCEAAQVQCHLQPGLNRELEATVATVPPRDDKGGAT